MPLHWRGDLPQAFWAPHPNLTKEKVKEEKFASSLSNPIKLEKMEKIQFPIEFLMENWNVFSRILYPIWYFAHTRKVLPLGFLIYLIFTKNFQ